VENGVETPTMNALNVVLLKVIKGQFETQPI
jgi:hypothetical protein